MSSIMENIHFDDFKNICRFCMFNCDIKFTQDSVISDISYKLTNIHFERNDELPQQICLKCFDKINEIQDFSFQCKRTYSHLTECLNKYKKSGLNQEQDVAENANIPKRNELLKIEEIEFVNSETLYSRNDNVNNELDLNRNVLEKTINELNDDMIAERIDQNINSSVYDLLISNTSHIEAQNEEESSNTKLNDLNEDTNSAKNSVGSNRAFTEIDKKESNKNKDKQYKCDVCNKRFTYLRTLKRHKQLHRCKRTCKCKQCLKLFSIARNLKSHIRPHSGERQYKCDQCSKLFTRLDCLKLHMRVHSGERPYKCDQCLKSFCVSSSLKLHMRTHSEERPYKCDQCSKSFTRLDLLKLHMRTHSGERPYKCDQCSKSFT